MYQSTVKFLISRWCNEKNKYRSQTLWSIIMIENLRDSKMLPFGESKSLPLEWFDELNYLKHALVFRNI